MDKREFVSWPIALFRLANVFAIALAVGFAGSAVAQNGSQTNDWLTVSFEQQSRIQTLDGQFRAGLEGEDTLFEMRNALSLEGNFEGFSVQTEIADMRTYLGDGDTPLDSFTTNPIDILQANISVPIAGVFSDNDEGFIKTGRFTMDQGSRRFVARNRYRNTINSFGGIQARLESGNKAFELFYTQPVIRRVSGDHLDNEPRLDKESSDKIFWGARLETTLGAQSDRFEAYILGLEENRKQAANQRFDILGTGVRVLRSPSPSAWHYELEGLYQWGDAPSLSVDGELRDHRAYYFFLNLGYSFEAAWSPRFSFLYHLASGDENPVDDESNNFDHFYGVPRPDFGPTGNFRAFQRFNVDSPGLMLNLQPASNVDAYIRLQEYSLDEPTQGWSTTRYRHPGSLEEDNVGTQLETRVRWHIPGNKLTIDGGYTWLSAGPYMDLVNKGDSHYFYLQTIVRL